MSKNFSIDARLILQLGRDSIKNHTTALTELIKNAYDADATLVTIEITNDYVLVRDNGFGMTEEEIDNNWLVIGYSEKRNSKKSQIGRRKTGEKGIGRIATDRLGANLRIITKSEDDNIQGLEINWDDFDVEKKPISSIDIIQLKNPSFLKEPINKKKSISGTELYITNLRELWTPSDIEGLYEELSYFISPLESNNQREFEIELITPIDDSFSKKVSPAIYDLAEIELEAHYDGKKEVIFTLKNRYEKGIKTKILDINEIYKSVKPDSAVTVKESLSCGSFDLSLKLYVQKTSLLSGTNLTLSDLRKFLNTNSGVKIYRDGVVVKPYGFVKSTLGHDWLNLAEKKARNPAGVGRDSYSITPNQLIGSIFIKRDKNPNVKDSASREGLVENEAFDDFKDVTLGAINLLESYRVEIIKKEESKKPKKKTTNDNVRSITKGLRDVNRDLEKIQSYLNQVSDYKGSPLTNTISKIGRAIEQTEKTFEELLDEKRTLSGLATLGISSAVFGHETETAINDLKSSSRNAMDYFDLNGEKAKNELKKVYDQAKLVAGWGTFALTRVEREKRIKRKRKISTIIKDSVNQIKPALDAKNIELIYELEDFYSTVFQMDIESVILNLVTNAYTFCEHPERRERKIHICCHKEVKEATAGFSISVSDTGYGVPKEYLHRVFSPLFSTKVGGTIRKDGTGLGLTIVKSIVDELNGEIYITKDENLKGAKFKVWLPIEI